MPVSVRWQRVTDFIQQNKLKASYGIIGWSLEQDNPAYFRWIKDLHNSGDIEFWNHGYRDRRAEDKTGEFEGPYAEQKAALEKTQRLAKEKLGIELRAFGPHWSGTNSDTAKALDGIPEIKMCFYDPKGAKQFVFRAGAGAGESRRSCRTLTSSSSFTRRTPRTSRASHCKAIPTCGMTSGGKGSSRSSSS